ALSDNPQALNVKLYLSDSVQGTNSAVDEINFDVQESLLNVANDAYEWVIPCAWKIEPVNGDKTITTPTPATADTIGPKKEGSLPQVFDATGKDTTKNGDAETISTYADGFTLELDFSFVRNTEQGYPQGYIRPDIPNQDEQDNNADRLQMDFCGNSGVKIFGVYEIQIFDTQALVDGMLIDSAEKVENGLITDQTIGARTYKGTAVDKVTSGIPYGKSNKATKDYTYDDLIAAKNAQLATNHVKIEFKKNTNDSFRIRVFMNNAVVPFFENLNVTNGTDRAGTELATLPTEKKKLYLQSHWGSGVTFSNIVIGPPPTDW
ncbi:MAG: hypothetical protein LBJ00_12270, partial [Planctomycetaceae bacterium]|nr:hypothetical protein [Planctomycetaceae bacterium]